jgi:hypothetical protein
MLYNLVTSDKYVRLFTCFDKGINKINKESTHPVAVHQCVLFSKSGHIDSSPGKLLDHFQVTGVCYSPDIGRFLKLLKVLHNGLKVPL